MPPENPEKILLSRSPETAGLLRSLFAEQRHAALATSQGHSPYLSLMSFAFTRDLGTIVLATPKDTRKFANLTANPNAALLVDNRKNTPEDSGQALAVTILGEAQAVEDDRAAALRDIFLARHPHLKEFVSNPDTALLQFKVRRYIVVSEFQNTVTIEV